MVVTNYIGTSGFSYRDWQGKVYPPSLPSRERFAFYSSLFNTVEVNFTFYRLPRESTVRNWRVQAPPGFVFCLKGSRYITHRLRLRGAGEAVVSFSERARLLGERLGAVLYQLPPGLRKDLSRLEEFLALLPVDIRHVIEFRHDSWLEEDVFSLLGRYGTAYCIVSAPGLRCELRATAPFVYIRFHGIDRWYDYKYGDEDMRWWAARIREFNRRGSPVYAYFNNDVNGYAVADAGRLRDFLLPGG